MPIAFVQVNTTITGISCAFTSPNTGGAVLVATCGEEATAGTITGVVDTNHNNWTVLPQQSTSGHISVFAYTTNCHAGANTVSFVTSGTPSGFGQISIAEYSGVNTLTAQAQNNTNAPPSVNITISGQPALIIGGFDNGYSTWTPDAGWTLRTSSTGGGSQRTAILDATQTSTGTFSPGLSVPTGTISSNALAFMNDPVLPANWVSRQHRHINKRG